MRHLGEDEAKALFATLAPGVAMKLRAAIAKLEAASPKRVDGIAVKYTPVTDSQSHLVSDAGHYVRDILNKAFGDVEAGVAAGEKPDAAQARESGFALLATLDAPPIAKLLVNEHPQIAAAILVQLGASRASEVLQNLPQRLRGDVMLRVAGMKAIHPAALKDLDEVLYETLVEQERLKTTPQGGENTAAEMMRLASAGDRASLIESMRQHDPGMAERISARLDADGGSPPMGGKA